MPSSQRVSALIWGLLGLLFAAAFLFTAWVCEDAFITLRTADHLIHGRGLVWNVGERVQAYTHPLWLFVVTPVVLLLGDPYFALIVASGLFSFLALFVLFRSRDNWDLYAIVGMASLLWSRSFVDYSSSGLENPLTHLLVATFVLVWLRAPDNRKGVLLGLLTSALYLNRPDSVVLVAPALAWHLLRSGQHLSVLMGLLPAMCWTVFSMLYYGSPVPNTALAKVATGLPLATRIEQAQNYMAWMLANDPVSLVIVVTGGLAAWTRPALRPFSLALLAWLAYLGYVGADYMGGRFFSAAVFLGAILLAHTMSKHMAAALGLTLLVFASALQQTVASPPDFANPAIDSAGIADERGFYYAQLGLMPTLQRGDWQQHPWLQQGTAIRQHPGVYTRCAIGMSGYTAGPGVYIIDPLALTEPFLARLPSRSVARIGHYERAFPDGYLASRVHERNDIKDPTLRALFDDVERVTRDEDLLTRERLAAIWRLNTGHHNGSKHAHQREAIGLPGIPVQTSSMLSCYGVPYGWDGFYRLSGDPVTASNVLTGVPR